MDCISAQLVIRIAHLYVRSSCGLGIEARNSSTISMLCAEVREIILHLQPLASGTVATTNNRELIKAKNELKFPKAHCRLGDYVYLQLRLEILFVAGFRGKRNYHFAPRFA